VGPAWSNDCLQGWVLIRRWARTVDATTIVVRAQCGSFALAGVLGLAVVPAASSMVQHLNEGWVRWTGALATLGFAVIILDNYWAIVTTSAWAAAYLAGTLATRATLTLPGAAPDYLVLASVILPALRLLTPVFLATAAVLDPVLCVWLGLILRGGGPDGEPGNGWTERSSRPERIRPLCLSCAPTAG